MEKQFKKEADGKTYLVLKKTKEAYEEHMIQAVRPPGILTMVKSEQADAYKYEITGKKNLTMTFERVPMNAEQIGKVLHGILDVLERGKEYLLTGENFILQPDYIYLTLPEYEVTLCYYPEYGVPFTEQMGKLFEMFLNRVDYREEKAIAMVYGLYMQLQEPDVTLERLKKKLREPAENLAEQEEFIPEPAAKTEMKEIVREGKAEKKKGILGKLRKEAVIRKPEKAILPKEYYKEPQVSYVMESATEWNPQYTRVLSMKKAEQGPSLVSQRSGEVVYLTKFPFYVGSLPGYMDLVISQDTVSRFHAKLSLKENRVYVTDLNSTNGTTVNEKSVGIQEEIPLCQGDCVRFAEEEYLFFEN